MTKNNAFFRQPLRLPAVPSAMVVAAGAMAQGLSFGAIGDTDVV